MLSHELLIEWISHVTLKPCTGPGNVDAKFRKTLPPVLQEAFPFIVGLRSNNTASPCACTSPVWPKYGHGCDICKLHIWFDARDLHECPAPAGLLHSNRAKATITILPLESTANLVQYSLTFTGPVQPGQCPWVIGNQTKTSRSARMCSLMFLSEVPMTGVLTNIATFCFAVGGSSLLWLD